MDFINDILGLAAAPLAGPAATASDAPMGEFGEPE